MFTKWVRLTAGVRYGGDGETIPGVPNSTPSNVGIIKAKSLGGNDYYVNAWAYYKGYELKVAALTDTSADGIYVGSGTGAESEDSYTLSNPITSGITGSCIRTYLYDASGRLVIRYTITITNNTESDITISEIGKVGTCPTASTLGGSLNSSAGGRKAFLLDRTLLEQPIVISAGDTSGINYDFVVFEPEVEP